MSSSASHTIASFGLHVYQKEFGGAKVRDDGFTLPRVGGILKATQRHLPRQGSD
jgi:hypothetical protein